MKNYLLAVLSLVLIETTGWALPKVLILDSTVAGGMNSLEAQAAVALGYQVDLVNATAWGNMLLTSDFSAYDAIILGDPQCGPLASIAPATLNRAIWSPAVNGNIIIIGTDPAYPHHGGATLTTNGIRFAANQIISQPHKTGLYITLSCYYAGSPTGTPIPVLDQFGVFTVKDVECYNQAHIETTHPVMNDLTDAILSNWSCSVHEAFNTWPSSYSVIAIAEGAGTAYTGTDLAVGSPYILANGEGLVPVTNRFSLTPVSASNPTNTLHTVCAKVVQNGALASGVTVTFTITSGPNLGTTGTVVTDGTGLACFTYAGIGGVGTDTVIAEYTDANSQTQTANSVSKTWFDPCGSTVLTASIGSVFCDTNVFVVNFNEIVDASTATDVFNYALDQGLNIMGITLLPGSTSVMITVDQNFVHGTVYTLDVTGISDLCGRFIVPDPVTLTVQCAVLCPDLKCSSNIVVQCEGAGGTKVHYDVYVDPACTNGLILSCYPPSDSLFPSGTTVVNCTAYSTNAYGSGSNICSFSVTVTDLIPPIINCPSNIVVTACTNIPVSFTVTASDNCTPNVPVVCSPPSGSVFTVGTTTPVHCVATDNNGNTNSCDFTVTVVPTTDCCCNGCTQPYHIDYAYTVNHGYNFLANNLCQGTNNSVNSVLTNLVSDPNGILNTELNYWNGTGFVGYSYFTGADADNYFLNTGSVAGWYDSIGNLASLTLSAGQGFVLYNPGAAFTLNIHGCLPTCPPPCAPPTSGMSLVGRFGFGTATWTNLFSCPPPCGARMSLWNGTGYTDYNYANGVWKPFPPVLAPGQSAFASVQPNSNCCSVVIACPTNKTIPCTSNVVFDLPGVSSTFCSTNYSISIFGSDLTTNLTACSYATTRTWRITDCCGNTNYCSQTITVAPSSSYTITLQPGLNLIANQLDNIGGNRATVLFPNSGGDRDGDGLYFWRCGVGYAIYYLDSGSPTGIDDQNYNPVAEPFLTPGMGVFYDNATGVPETVTFTGTPRCPAPTPTLCPCGILSLVSYELDCFGTYQNIAGLSPQPGSEVQRWNGTGYTTYTFTGGAWTPSTPVLNVGEAAFILVPCPTNSCFTLTCATNKTVSCGSNWSFDAPTNVIDHCCTNYGVNFTTATNSSPCPLMITRTWIIADTCGNATNCSQTVTVVACVTPPIGMVGWWPGDGNANDIIGGNNGTLLGGASYTAGEVGQAFNFTGSGQSVQVADSAGLHITVAISIDAWINPATAGASYAILNKATAGTGDGYYFDVYQGHLRLLVGNAGVLGLGAYFTSTQSIPPNQWTHVAGTYDGATLKLFINGALDGSLSVAGVFPVNARPLLIGNSSSGAEAFLGVIDEVELFNRVLVTNEITAISAAGPAGKCKSPKLVCSAPKSVPCGTPIIFDRPAITNSCCGTNGAVVPFGSDVPGGTPCSPTFTRTWLYVDCCGYSNICSQTVTVIDTTPPTIVCSTNITVSDNGTGGAIVNYAVTTTNLCNTNVVLVCTPPSGALFPCGTNVVTCVATDACGKSNVCSFLVTVACSCLGVSNEQLLCSTNTAGQQSYSFNLQNSTGVPVKYLYLVPNTNCFSFSPDITTFRPPLLPGQSANVSVTLNLSGGCASNLCFTIAAHDSNFVQCCSITHCLAATVGPHLASVTPVCGGNKITVTFSSSLDQAMVLSAPNFILDDLTHHISLVLSSASFGQDFKTVNLFTAGTLSAGTQYQLTVNNVKDACGNAIAPNSQLSFCCPYPDHRLLWTFVNGQLCLSWVCDGVLEYTSSLNPPVNWQPTPSQANPQCFMPGSGQKYFRLRQ